MLRFGRYPVADGTRDWLLDGLLWCAEAGIRNAGTPLVVPIARWFPARGGADRQAVAEGLLRNVLAILGMADAEIDLAPVEAMGAAWRHEYGALSAVGGTWQGGDGGRSLIRYDPEAMSRPVAFLATLAHEAMHERLHRTDGDWPGGAETEEPMTDLAVIAAGMGVLQMAGAEDLGWQGYLRQESRAHALALELVAMEADPAEALAHLPGRAAKALRRALREVAGGAEADELRAAIGLGVIR